MRQNEENGTLLCKIRVPWSLVPLCHGSGSENRECCQGADGWEVHAGCWRWAKGWFTSLGEKEGMVWEFAMLPGKAGNSKPVDYLSGIFHLIFLDCSSPRTAETAQSKPTGKGELLSTDYHVSFPMTSTPRHAGIYFGANLPHLSICYNTRAILLWLW